MEDNRNSRFNRDSDQTPDRDVNGSSQNSESGSSYYYSYGPFKSIGQDEHGGDNVEHYNRREPERVEITPPQPVRPLSYQPTSQFRPSPYDSARGGSGDGGSNGGNGGWQYNKKPKSPFKTAAVSFLAGMVVLGGSMFAADRGNWFTSDPVEKTVATSAQGTAANESAGSAPATTTTLFTSSGPNDVSSVVNEAGPAVVKIETLVNSNSRGGGQSSPYSNDPFYQFFFGDQFGSRSGSSNQGERSESEGQSQLVPYGIGTGFIYDKEGYILTNEHVIGGADVIQVTVDGNTKPYEAKLLGSSKDLDLAVLKIEGDDSFPVVPLGESGDSLKVGSEVVAIGNPQGFDHTVTAGVLSAKGRSIDINEEDGSGTRNYKNLLQTDASINPGNSGGPLLNLNGQVIGMNVAVSTEAQGIGFAIAVDTIKNVVDKLEANQQIPKEPVPFIGASLMTITDEVAAQMGTDIKEGSVVADIIYKSPAYTADLRPYDIITGINGKKYATSQELIDYIQTLKVGDKVTLNVVRDGKTLDLSVTIGNKNDFNTETQQRQ